MPNALERRRRILAKLPPLEEVLRGSVLVRFLRCGKPGCHCAEDEGHRATYLSVTLAGGRTEQISLPAPPRSSRRRPTWFRSPDAGSPSRAWWAAIEKLSAINRDQLREQRRQP